jgi:two-component system, cell cycle sensor histidine kinase and response regulator CckA
MDPRKLTKEELASELRQKVAEIASLKDRLRHVEDTVKAYEERQRILFENPIVAIGLSDGNQILFANRLLLDLFGYSDLDEFLSIPLIDHVAPSSRAAIMDRLEKAAGGVSLESTFFYDIKRKDGSIRTVEINVIPYLWKGKPCRFSLFRDITERKQAEDAFRESEKKYRVLVETTDTGYVILDLEGRVLDANPEYVRLTGHKALLEILGRRVIEWTAQYDIARNTEEISKCLKEGFVRNLEVDYVNKDGKPTPIEINATTLQTAEGIRIVTLCRDITERKRAVEALRESTEYLNRIINCIGDPLFVKDRRHAFVLINEAFCHLAGKRREELIGITIDELLPKKQAELIAEREEAVFFTGKECIVEEEFIDAKREIRTNMTRTTLLKDKTGEEQIVGIIRDITELKRLEVQFLQSQKMEAIGVLAGGIAHDFNNLLSVINGYCELLMNDLDPNHRGMKDLEQIRLASRRAASLISQLLAFSRRQILQPQVVNLNEVVADTCKILRRIIGETIELTIVAHPDLWSVRADPAQIEQVIMNLAVNARDAMPKGGTLTIETANIILDEANIREFPDLSPGPHVLLAVRDNGIGIDREVQPHIFEPFFTTKSVGRGTGLGLSTVYGIIKQSKGSVGIDSEVGKGTTLRIFLPRARSEAQKSSGAAGTEHVPSGTETILLVEDDDSVRKLTSSILVDRGYHVIEASNGNEALNKASEYPGEIQLMVTDIVMPGMSGFELAVLIRQARQAINVLFISGYANDDIVQNNLIDPTTLLQKPFTSSSLAHKVREMIDAAHKNKA